MLGSMEDVKILTAKKMTVNGSINLLNWMGEMLLTCLMTRCRSNRDDILHCFILLTLIFLRRYPTRP